MNILTQAFKMVLLMTCLTGIIYPAIITLYGKYFYPNEIVGDLISFQNRTIGARLIGQKFEKDKFFWGRPSSCDYDPLKTSPSNLSPTSLILKQQVESRKKRFTKNPIPSDLLFASGSGLDPHISLSSALFQVDRIAKARKIEPGTVINLIENYAENDFINVLIINKALEEIAP